MWKLRGCKSDEVNICRTCVFPSLPRILLRAEIFRDAKVIRIRDRDGERSFCRGRKRNYSEGIPRDTDELMKRKEGKEIVVNGKELTGCIELYIHTIYRCLLLRKRSIVRKHNRHLWFYAFICAPVSSHPRSRTILSWNDTRIPVANYLRVSISQSFLNDHIEIVRMRIL